MDTINTSILKLFVAYTANEITEEQFKTLKEWIDQDPENKQQFLNFLQFYKKTRRIGFVETLDKNHAWNKVVSQLERPLIIKASQKEKKPIKLYWKYAVAASVLLMATLTIFLNKKAIQQQFDEPIIVNNDIEVGTDKAVLTLEDGSKVPLGKGQKYQTNNISSNDKEIVYNAISKTEPEISYNYLTIPRGGQFFVKLSDGTKVWLNSESQLKYPKFFIEGELREVELVYGEAYFEVSPSSDHKGAKFKVFTGDQEVEVLGTEFNIKAYQDENHIYTTLIEGSIALSNGVKKQKLNPNEQLVLNVNTKGIQVNPINVKNEISWKKGDFVFSRKSLKYIMKVLERWYDVNVVFSNSSLQDIEFTGELGKNQNIEEILILIKNTKIINSYVIDKNTITLK
ncbi:FecR family protein [Flavivirga eckloniae]|uniref:Anti-sigma factor n=1 Tax=Flavivirga eckloniae TaxID=1803846 RepID=A0A2K9PSY3_9FLAO|nr:FecR family protein [Flavivirga eckloniae]AUP80174.1 anti-sigma factor [Flavivirga eckloniae]